MKSNQEKLIDVAQGALDPAQDASPDDLAKDEVGCAESVSNLIKKVLPDFKIEVSTAELLRNLKNDKRFVATLTPHIGCVVVSPRTATQNGHCGIFITNERIASNDSKTGLWKPNYSWQSWIAYFRDKKGLRTFLFELNG